MAFKKKGKQPANKAKPLNPYNVLLNTLSKGNCDKHSQKANNILLSSLPTPINIKLMLINPQY